MGASAAPSLVLDDLTRGIPPGTPAFAAVDIGGRGWHPAAGEMSLPVLTLDDEAFAANRDLMLRYAREQGVAIAPHAKTPMAPALARSLISAGAWGATVADIRQAGAMLRAGISHVIIANEVGGRGGARRLAAMLAQWPEAEVHVFADSLAGIAALAEAWSARPDIAPLNVLVEQGAGRAGERTLIGAEALMDAVVASGGRLRLSGVACYEGSAVQSTPELTEQTIRSLLDRTGEALRQARERVGPNAPLLVTAGGSVFFDRVVSVLKPIVQSDPNATLVLRSGAIFFYDHGVYDRALAALDARNGFTLGGKILSAREALRPALRLWAQILSRPEPDLAICGMGMRDVSFDQDFPTPLRRHRDGGAQPALAGWRVTKLNDQHAYLAVGPYDDIAVGDVIEFGVSHPCTCLDRYRVIFGVDGDGIVRNAYSAEFG